MRRLAKFEKNRNINKRSTQSYLNIGFKTDINAARRIRLLEK